jgi:4-hydroxy-tetrahydrodipicolinate synthase
LRFRLRVICIFYMLRNQLGGTGVALITPFMANGEIDFDALERMIDFVINNGVEYLVTLGTTGETPVLSKEEKKDIALFTYEKVNGRVPIVTGIGGNNTAELVKELESFPLEQATAVLSASPWYSKPSQEGIFRHYEVLAKASPRPIILYNVPGRTSSNLTAATTLRLAAVPNIGGIKEASGNMVQCMHILRNRPNDFLVTSGDDHLALPLIASGMDGVISVAANCFPRHFTDMIRYCLKGDFEAARPLHYKLLEGMDLLFAENNPAGVKAVLARLGLIGNYLRLPVLPLSEALQQQVNTCMDTY